MTDAEARAQEATQTAPVRAVDVFISHGSEDAEIARQIRGHLETGGYRCWMAPDDVSGPESWAEQIVHAIQACRVMVVLVSDRANRSPHVSKEVDLAMEAGKPLLPVRVEDVVPRGALQYLLALAQWVDAFPGPLDRHAAAVKARIAAILGDEADAAAAGDAHQQPQAPPASSAPVAAGPASPAAARQARWPGWLPWAGGAAAVLAVVAIGIAVMSGGSAETTTTTTLVATVDTPFVYGDDAGLDALWDACAAADRDACAALEQQSPFGSEYREFGATCGFRTGGCAALEGATTPPGNEREVLRSRCSTGDPAACLALYESAGAGSEDELLAMTCGYGEGNCTDRFGEPFTYGDDPYLDGLWDECAIGNGEACRLLFDDSPVDSVYEHYGYVCGRLDTGCAGLDQGETNTAVLDQWYDECGAGSLPACGELVLRAPPDSFYVEHGWTCAGIEGGCVTLTGGASAPGDHPYLDELALLCAGGSAPHCDLLWWWAPTGSDYEWLAEACAEAAAAGEPCEAGIS